MSIATTAQGTGNILTNRIAVNMSDKISELEPNAAPLLVLTKKLNTKVTTNSKFEWLEEDPEARWVSRTGTVESTAGTTVNLTTGEGASVSVGELLKVARTGEVLRVTAVSTDALTVVRAFGTTTAAVLNDNEKLLILGNAIMQGDSAPAEKYTTQVPCYNYTQIFRSPYSVTNTLDKTKLIGEDELARLRRRKAIEHAKGIEYSLLFGERKLLTTGAQPLSTSAGVITYLNGNVNNTTVAAASVTEADFEAFCEKVFTYGSTEKVMISCPALITKINQWAKGKLELVQADMDKTYGLNIYKYMTPHGVLDIVKHPLFVQGYNGHSIVLDMEELAYRPLTDRDTTLKTNIQNNDEDGRRDEYITEAGLELRMPKKHGMFILTDVGVTQSV